MAAGIFSNLDHLILHDVSAPGIEIGRGAYGRVFEVDYAGTLYAAKEIHKLLLQSAGINEFQKLKDDFLHECHIWSTLRHPHIVQFLGVYYPATSQYNIPIMVMEKMLHSLKNLTETYENIPLYVKLSILDEVCLGLRYLHGKNPPIVHRDLTPNNILLSSRLEAKITDLGVSKVIRMGNAQTMTRAPGTIDFMPPEALVDRPVYNLPIDVFSYGGVVLYTITQVWPQPSSWVQFDPNTGKREVLSEVQRRQYYLDMIPEDTAELTPLVTACMADYPGNRPSVTQVSNMIKGIKNLCSQKDDRDGINPIIWWAEVFREQKEYQPRQQLQQQLQQQEQQQQQNQQQLQQHQNYQQQHQNYQQQQQQIQQQLKQQQKQSQTLHENDMANGPELTEWKQVASAPLPVNRVGHTAMLLNNKVYVGGDNESIGKGSYVIRTYNVANNLWSESSISVPFCYFAIATLKNCLIIAGGHDKRGIITDKVLLLENDQLKEYVEMLTPKYEATAASHDKFILIIGGISDGKLLASTELLNNSTGQWHICGNLPRPHSWLKSVKIKNVLYLLGGCRYNGFLSYAVFCAELDDLIKHQLKWQSIPDTPWKLSAPACMHGKHLLAIGGGKPRGEDYAYDRILASDVFMFNKVNQNWELIGHLPSARYGPVAVNLDDDSVMVMGGVNAYSPRTDNVWIGTVHEDLDD